MSDERASSGIDPQFDPRFQRGYIPDAATEPPAPLAPRDQAPTPSRQRWVGSPPGDDVSTTASASPVRPEPRDATPTASRNIPELRDETPTASRDIPEPRDETPTALGTAESPAAAQPSPSDPWWIAACAFPVVAVVGGFLLMWGSVSGDNAFGPESETEQWVQLAAWTIAPVVVAGGLIGIVVVLVWTGTHHARRRSSDRGSRFLRNPAALVLAALAVAACVATAWAIGVTIDANPQFGPGPAATEEQMAQMRLAAIAGVIPPLATLAAVFAVLGILLIGAFAGSSSATGSVSARRAR